MAEERRGDGSDLEADLGRDAGAVARSSEISEGAASSGVAKGTASSESMEGAASSEFNEGVASVMILSNSVVKSALFIAIDNLKSGASSKIIFIVLR